MWRKSLDDEYLSLLRNDTWELVQSKEEYKVIGSKWIFKRKRHADGNVLRYKARLIALGYN